MFRVSNLMPQHFVGWNFLSPVMLEIVSLFMGFETMSRSWSWIPRWGPVWLPPACCRSFAFPEGLRHPNFWHQFCVFVLCTGVGVPIKCSAFVLLKKYFKVNSFQIAREVLPVRPFWAGNLEWHRKLFQKHWQRNPLFCGWAQFCSVRPHYGWI